MAYIKNAGIRAGRTFVQAFVAVMIANQANLFEADVIMAALVAGASAVVSVLQNALEDAPFAFMSKIPKTPETQPECPTEIQRLKEPVGEVIGDERVVEHRLVQNGNSFECITIKEKIDIPTQVLENIPDVGTVTATVAVAVTATTSALLAKPLADLLLRLVKPATKKVLEKIAVLRGKKIPAQSVSARLAEQRQRNQAAKALRSVRPLKRK